MAVGTALLLGGMAMQGVGMYQKKSMSDYNARLAEIEGARQERAADEEARMLADEQRELRASQRVALAAGGAGSMQEQPLMLLADQANKMQLDQIEIRRRGDIARSRARSRSLLQKMQGREAMLSGTGKLLGMGYSGYQAWKGTQSAGSVADPITGEFV